MSTVFTTVVGDGQVVSTAIHAGHRLRPEVSVCMALDEATRRREEDPYTELMLMDRGVRVTVDRSRFEVDLNRSRDECVYLEPADAWGLTVWASPLPEAEIERSRGLHDEFYRGLAGHMDRLAVQGPFLVLDLHSYNHRRAGPGGPAADAAENPEVNVGTGALDPARWRRPVDVFIEELRGRHVSDHQLDVRENVKFRGGHLSRWVAAHYPATGCVLSVEFKKVFMDEWTDEYDAAHVQQLRDAVAATLQPVLDAIGEVA